MFSKRQRELVRYIWQEGSISRSEISRLAQIRPNTVGTLIADLMDQGVLRECEAVPSEGGRPRMPLEIDPVQRHVAGLSICPGIITGAVLNLRGQLVGEMFSESITAPEEVIEKAAKTLKRIISPKTLGVGLTVTGFVDTASHSLLFSSAVPGQRAVSLQPVFSVAGDLPVIVDNDMHAMAADWLLTHRIRSSHDVLVVKIGDGSLGAAMLVDGKPSRGCVNSANELGHMRFFVDTDNCYCGHTGCLERICSTRFLASQKSSETGTLQEQAQRFTPENIPLMTIIKYLSMGIANAVNFVRPHRLVLANELAGCPGFIDELIRATRGAVLPELVDRVDIEIWGQLASCRAESGGWLALAGLYCDGWGEESE
jgi:predicted NBD/HSP70 family sugar kinase